MDDCPPYVRATVLHKSFSGPDFRNRALVSRHRNLTHAIFSSVARRIPPGMTHASRFWFYVTAQTIRVCVLVFMLSSKSELAAALVVLATRALEILVDHPNTRYLSLPSHTRSPVDRARGQSVRIPHLYLA